jgi:ABC-type Fe3+ transport system substrate-binding protein
VAPIDLRAQADAARAERRLVVRGLTDPRSMVDLIWPAFQADLAPWAELDYAQDVSGRRLLAEVEGAEPGRRPTVVLVSSPAMFDDGGLAQPFEQPSRELLPSSWVDPAGRWAAIYVQPIVVIYNAHRALPPRAWTDLAADRYAERVVFDAPERMLTTGPAFAELRSALGDGEWRSFLITLAAHRPRLVGDNERAVLEVSTGARWLGLSNWNVARRVRAGSPVRYVFLHPTPCIPGFGLLVRDAPAAALGRLFLAWLTSEAGQRAYARTGRIPAMPRIDAELSLDAVLPTGAEPVFGSTDWLVNPGPWIQTYRTLIPAEPLPAAEGKLH